MIANFEDKLLNNIFILEVYKPVKCIIYSNINDKLIKFYFFIFINVKVKQMFINKRIQTKK